jgi:hypothetical protein
MPPIPRHAVKLTQRIRNPTLRNLTLSLIEDAHLHLHLRCILASNHFSYYSAWVYIQKSTMFWRWRPLERALCAT